MTNNNLSGDYARFLEDTWRTAVTDKLNQNPSIPNQTLQYAVIQDPNNQLGWRDTITLGSLDIIRRQCALQLMKRAAEVILGTELDWSIPPAPIAIPADWNRRSGNNYPPYGGYWTTTQYTADNQQTPIRVGTPFTLREGETTTGSPNWQLPALQEASPGHGLLIQELEDVGCKEEVEQTEWSVADLRSLKKVPRQSAPKKRLPTEARVLMENVFNEKWFITRTEREQLAEQTKLTEKQIANWFSNRRYTMKSGFMAKLKRWN